MAGRFSSIRSTRNFIGVSPPFRSHSASLSRPKPGLVPVCWAGLLIVLARVSLLPLRASSCRLPGRSTPLVDSLVLLYVAAAIGGLGAGAVYGTCVANALKWFPDRRGLAAGLTAAGFGAGAAATVIPIRNVIFGYGYEAAFLWFGLAQGLVKTALSQACWRAAAGRNTKTVSTASRQSLREYAPLDMLKSSVFWLLYVMFVLVAGSGLMATAQIAPIAVDFKLADREVTVLFVAATTLSVALVFDNVLNGLARPFFGWISDIIGRENTMAIVFSLGALAYWGLSEFGHEPYMFIIMTALIFFTWGEIFSVFPATCTDTFGAKYATTNAGIRCIPRKALPGSGSGSWPVCLEEPYWSMVFGFCDRDDNESCGCGSCVSSCSCRCGESLSPRRAANSLPRL